MRGTIQALTVAATVAGAIVWGGPLSSEQVLSMNARIGGIPLPQVCNGIGTWPERCPTASNGQSCGDGNVRRLLDLGSLNNQYFQTPGNVCDKVFDVNCNIPFYLATGNPVCFMFPKARRPAAWDDRPPGSCRSLR
jgi:hypothetical protein